MPKIPFDIHGFRKIYDLYYEPLCRFLLFYTKDIQLVEDIVQEVFLQLWENKDKVEVTYIKTYLFQSAKNKMINRLRDDRNRSLLLEKWFEEQLQNHHLDKDKFETEKLLIVVERAIDELPEKCREIFILNKTEKLTYKEIAETKQISIKTVENQMGIALKKIRKYLSDNWSDSYIISLPVILTIFS